MKVNPTTLSNVKTLYRAIISISLASYAIGLLALNGVFVDGLLESESGCKTIIFLIILSLMMGYWSYSLIKKYRASFGPVFPSNPGVQSEQYSDWKTMKITLICALFLTLLSLIVIFQFPESLHISFAFLLSSLPIFSYAGESAREVLFGGTRDESNERPE